MRAAALTSTRNPLVRRCPKSSKMRHVCILVLALTSLSSGLFIPGWRPTMKRSTTDTTTVPTSTNSLQITDLEESTAETPAITTAVLRNWQDGPGGVKWSADCKYNPLATKSQKSQYLIWRHEDCMNQCSFGYKECTHFTYSRFERACRIIDVYSLDWASDGDQITESNTSDGTCGFVPARIKSLNGTISTAMTSSSTTESVTLSSATNATSASTSVSSTLSGF